MVEFRIPGAEFLSAAVLVVCLVIALIAINVRASGRSRTSGLTGLAMLFLSAVLGALNTSLGSAYGTKVVAYQVGSVLVAALTAAGMVLLALAVVWARRPTRSRGERR
jgi:drug/metabolite transporter (DMT)-like permease